MGAGMATRAEHCSESVRADLFDALRAGSLQSEDALDQMAVADWDAEVPAPIVAPPDRCPEVLPEPNPAPHAAKRRRS
eukprot:24541-Lingulodinium_polyedra.AAC.1